MQHSLIILSFLGGDFIQEGGGTKLISNLLLEMKYHIIYNAVSLKITLYKSCHFDEIRKNPVMFRRKCMIENDVIRQKNFCSLFVSPLNSELKDLNDIITVTFIKMFLFSKLEYTLLLN